MVYLQATLKAREYLGLGREPLDAPKETQSALGNWLLNIVPVGQRTAFLFMSARSLLSFPILIGRKQPTANDIPGFMAHGLTQLMKSMKTPRAQSSLMLQDLDEILLCRPTDKSLLGVFSGVAADYHARTLAANNRSGSEIGSILMAVNSAPKASLGWKTPFEVSIELLAGAA